MSRNLNGTKKKLRRYRKINLLRAIKNDNENWMMDKLSRTGFKWQRQRLFGFRIFDFFCPEIGIAVEVDGQEHDKAKDDKRDSEYFKAHAIEVLRVRNKNEDDARKALLAIAVSETWTERKIANNGTTTLKKSESSSKWRVVKR